MRRLLLLGICSLTIAGCTTGNVTDNSSTQLLLSGVIEHQNIQIIQRGNTLRAIVYTNRCFEPNEPRIKKACYPGLMNLATLLKTYKVGTINVAGYTDNVFDAYSAQFVTQQQAEAMLAFLWSQGIPATRFQVIGYGLKDPIASNRNTCASGNNRRIELSIKYNFQNQRPRQFSSKSSYRCYKKVTPCYP